MRNIKVPGCAFADLLMVQEFVYNFGEALDIGKILVSLVMMKMTETEI